MPYSPDVLLIVLGTVLTAFFAGCGFVIKTFIDEFRHLNHRMDTMALDIADMKPKVNALWEHFLTVGKPDE